MLCNRENAQLKQANVGFPHVGCSLPFHFGLGKCTPKIFHFCFKRILYPSPQVPITISAGFHKLLRAQTPSLLSLGAEVDNTRSCRATLILGTNSTGTQLKGLAGCLRFACRVLCVFSSDQSHCEKLWFSIHFFAYGKEDGFVQWLFKNTSKELESVHGCTIYKLK